MTTENHEALGKPRYAPEVWGEILNHHPEITAVSYALYPPHPHGTSGRFLTQTEYTIPSEFRQNSWPDGGITRSICAISSLVGTNLEEGRWRSVFVFNPFCHPYGMDYDLMQVNPKTFIFLDFESPNNTAAQTRILESLQKVSDPWFLLDSGGSYHLVIDKLINPQDLPQYWGHLINTFTLHPNTRQRETFLGIGNYLCSGWSKPYDLKILAEDILSDFGHIDDGDLSKNVFVVDMRHLAHSLVELANWLDGQDEAFCFLRVSNTSKYPQPPQLKALHNNSKTILSEVNKPPSGQLQLEI